LFFWKEGPVSGWLYLTLGFAVFFVLFRKEGPAREKEIWVFSLRLLVALAGLVTLTGFLRILLWIPSGRRDFELLSLFFWAFLVDRIMNRARNRRQEKGTVRIALSRFSLALFGFSFWTLEGAATGGLPVFLQGISLPLATGFFEWLLEGLRARLRLSNVPSALEGAPIFFLLTGLLALALHGFEGIGKFLVN